MSRMDRQNPRWEEFCGRLDGKEGCNFREEDGEDVWTCGGGTDKSLATAILEKMGEIDIPASLAWFEDHGGYCDCEILFNCDRQYDPRRRGRCRADTVWANLQEEIHDYYWNFIVTSDLLDPETVTMNYAARTSEH